MLLEITPWLRNPEVHVMPKTMETESLSETSRAWRASGRNTIGQMISNWNTLGGSYLRLDNYVDAQSILENRRAGKQQCISWHVQGGSANGVHPQVWRNW